MKYMFTPLDRKILHALQADAKLSMQALGTLVGASAAQCWRRVKLLEDAGVIEGYGARVNAKKLGLSASAVVHVAIAQHDPENIDAFLRFVEAEDQIAECASITGDHDFVLLVHAASPEELETLIMKRILASSWVKGTRSHFVLRHVKTRGSLPVDETAMG